MTRFSDRTRTVTFPVGCNLLLCFYTLTLQSSNLLGRMVARERPMANRLKWMKPSCTARAEGNYR